MHDNLPDDLKGPCIKTPAPENLLKIDPNSKTLSQRKSDHHYEKATKIIWLDQRGRPDAQLATGCNCTKVKLPIDYDLEKLKWMIGHS